MKRLLAVITLLALVAPALSAIAEAATTELHICDMECCQDGRRFCPSRRVPAGTTWLSTCATGDLDGTLFTTPGILTHATAVQSLRPLDRSPVSADRWTHATLSVETPPPDRAGP